MLVGLVKSTHMDRMLWPSVCHRTLFYRLLAARPVMVLYLTSSQSWLVYKIGTSYNLGLFPLRGNVRMCRSQVLRNALLHRLYACSL